MKLPQIKAMRPIRGNLTPLSPALISMSDRTSPSKPRILIVDDEPEVLRALTFMAEAHGYDVQCCANAREAFVAAEDGFACLVVDLNLPDGRGIDLVEALRSRGLAAPAILVTTDPSAALRRQAGGIGAPIVEKPLLGEDLFSQIARLTGPG